MGVLRGRVKRLTLSRTGYYPEGTQFRLCFALRLFAIVFLNQNALEFIAKVLGLLH